MDADRKSLLILFDIIILVCVETGPEIVNEARTNMMSLACAIIILGNTNFCHTCVILVIN